MAITRTEFLRYPVDNVNLQDILDFVREVIKENSYHFIAVQNANKMYLSEKYPKLKDAIKRASIILPENSINIGMHLLGQPLKERNIGGVITMEEFLRFSDSKSYSIYLLGAKEEDLLRLISVIKNKFPNVVIKGYRNGYFKKEEETLIVDEIGKLKPNFLFVGLGSPKQEIFIHEHFDKLNTNICLGVGGSFKVIAGLEKPAPKWTKYGIEWLYRAIQDPKKFKRYLVINSFFLYKFLKYNFKK